MNVHMNSRNAPKLRSCNSSWRLFSSSDPGMKEEKPRVFFSSAIAHEVRNPLTNINLAIDMLTSTFLGTDQKIYVDIIKQASIRINGLVTELLTSGEPDEVRKYYTTGSVEQKQGSQRHRV
jgi:signal transduction histidine kinase